MKLLKQLETLHQAGTSVGQSDGQLLDRFLEGSDESAEAAFAALVQRHGGMVLRVCRQVLGDEHDAQDASQAAFLVLARKARSIGRRESVSSWLYGVALRVAQRARLAAARRQKREHRGGQLMAARRDAQENGDGAGDGERWARLYAELGRLPESFRAPLVLCYLQGLSQEQAAAQLHCPLGTVQSRLARGKAKLKNRLETRGADISGLLLTSALPGEHLLRAPESWAEATVRLALDFVRAKGPAGAGAGLVSATLAEEVLRGFVMIKLRLGLAAVLLAGMLVSGAAIWAGQGGGKPGSAKVPSAAVAKQADDPKKPQEKPKEPSIVDRTVRGTVRDEQGRPVAKVWVGEHLRPQPSRWQAIEPPDRVRESKEPFRSEQGEILPPGTLGKYFEVRDGQGTWRPVRPGDLRVYQPPPYPEPFNLVPESIAAARARGQTVYELRSRKWGLDPAGRVPVRTDSQGHFSLPVTFIRDYPDVGLVFATADFSRQAIHVVRVGDPDRPLDITLLPAREVRARVIETPGGHPDEWLGCTVYTVDPALASLYDIPAIGAKGAVWGDASLESFVDARAPVETRRLDVQLPAGKYKVRFTSDSVYDVVDLVVLPGESVLDLPDIKIKTLAWTRMLGKPAAEIEAVDQEGRPVRLADHRGKVVILAFWSSKSAPDLWPSQKLKSILDRFGDKALSVLTIHDASVTSLVRFKQVLEPIHRQIREADRMHWLLDRVPIATGGNLQLHAGEPGSGRTADTYEPGNASIFVIDRTGRLVYALVDSLAYVATFSVGKQGERLEDWFEAPDDEERSGIAMNALEDVLADQFGVPRPAKPGASAVEARRTLPKGPFVIKGKVVDSGGRPVAGALVRYDPLGKKSITTGPAGEFRFTLHEVEEHGQHITVEAAGLTVEAAGMAPKSVWLSYQGDNVAASGLEALRVKPGGMIEQPLRLSSGAIVTGRLLRDGKAVVGATVSLNNANGSGTPSDRSIESKTDERGGFRFPHVPPQSDLWASVKIGSLENQGAVRARRFQTHEEGSALDLGVLAVQKGRKLAGRLVRSDGKTLPHTATLYARIAGEKSSIEAKTDTTQRFEFYGIPDGPIQLSLSGWKTDGAVGYHLSPKNVCLNPRNLTFLEGLVDHDITDLTILLDPGEGKLPELARMMHIDPSIKADFNDAKAGPITGVPPADYPQK